MTSEMKNDLTSQAISERIEKSGLRPEVKSWLSSEVGNLHGIVARYQEHPDMIEIPADAPEDVVAMRKQLRENPLVVVDTIILSAETLYSYQSLYKQALLDIANSSGIDSENISFGDLAREIERVTCEREKARIDELKENGEKLAVPILGIGGTGKGTMIKLSGVPRVVNHTTRLRRPGETEGVDYYYVDGVDLEGYKVSGKDDNGSPILEMSEDGKPVDLHEQLNGPFVADLIRPGRGRYSTSVKSVNDSLEKSDVVFIEQSPEQVKVIGQRVPELMDKVKVIPVCILPPGTGILELATRVIVRTYGDPTHKDPESAQYKIKDSYLESTVGPGQIQEISQTADFMKGQNKLGIAYIVNDDLDRAVSTLKYLVL